MTLVATETFSGRWTSFWATTYTFDLAFFDQFLFRRLGEPPLNANVLADFEQVTAIWEDSRTEPWRLRRVNRDYLVRGVRLPRGRFHPKSYFFANKDRGILLVGSGNLGMHGLADGNEVFCRFDSQMAEDLPVILGWHAWMSRLIVRLDDQTMATRWRHLGAQAPWLGGLSNSSSFVSNLEEGLIDQLTAMAGSPVDELHVLAPFFDADAEALATLIERLQPRAVHLYQTAGMNVDGTKLAAVLERSDATVRLLAFDHDAFVHAKLFGVITGEYGVLLSGSANCSRAALLTTIESGNAEAGILARLPPVLVREAFRGCGWTIRDQPLAELAALTFRQHPRPETGWPITLLSATWHDGFVAVTVSGKFTHAESSLATGGDKFYPIRDGRTIDKVVLNDEMRLVWLVDADGQTCSNAVPVDDPQQLASWLGERRIGGDRPPGLDPPDLYTPLGKLIQWLNGECIFDVEETPAFSGAARTVGDETEEELGDAGFWDRIQAEELRLDPRATRYARLARRSPSGGGWLDEDDVFRLLREMLYQVPGEVRLMLYGGVTEQDGETNVGERWSPDRRVQVRFGNVLKRWSRALADPRLRWLSPYAPVRNYVGLLSALAQCQMHGHLSKERVADLVHELLASFVGCARQPGYLLMLPEEERTSTLEMVAAAEAPALAAALIYSILDPQTRWQKIAFDWQLLLVPALDHGVVRASNGSEHLVQTMVLANRSATEINDHLRRVATYMNDDRWCEVMQEHLGLDKVDLVDNFARKEFPLIVRVTGLPEPLRDPRLVTVVRRAFAYRKVPGLIVEIVSKDGARSKLALRLGRTAYADIKGANWRSTEPTTDQLMGALEELGLGWEETMEPEPS